ncbi:PREDICTED: uncharacterized protein LOC106811630 [Priapulus caudatus]|uniref:Uncharacterized protein LOC106811630 n=1 Tax=Priapulus caudatus TaxID=37621 RepID=A0ABM1EF49_PRICU|nr:PREDICTED: uncharacterized protein LOC106811630 [Priapulus caudatus]
MESVEAVLRQHKYPYSTLFYLLQSMMAEIEIHVDPEEKIEVLGQQPYECNVPGCRKEFSKFRNLRRHRTSQHGPVLRQYACPHCTEQHSARREDIVKHCARKHPGLPAPRKEQLRMHETPRPPTTTGPAPLTNPLGLTIGRRGTELPPKPYESGRTRSSHQEERTRQRRERAQNQANNQSELEQLLTTCNGEPLLFGPPIKITDKQIIGWKVHPLDSPAPSTIHAEITRSTLRLSRMRGRIRNILGEIEEEENTREELYKQLRNHRLNYEPEKSLKPNADPRTRKAISLEQETQQALDEFRLEPLISPIKEEGNRRSKLHQRRRHR